MCPLPIHYSICLPLSSLHPHSHCLLIFFSPCRMLMRAIVEHLLFTAPPISLETSSLSFASLLILFYLPNFLGLTLPPPSPQHTHPLSLPHLYFHCYEPFIAPCITSSTHRLCLPSPRGPLILPVLHSLTVVCAPSLSLSPFGPLSFPAFSFPLASSALLPLLFFPSPRNLSQTIPTCDISTLEMRLSDARTSELHIQIHKRAQTLIGLLLTTSTLLYEVRHSSTAKV